MHNRRRIEGKTKFPFFHTIQLTLPKINLNFSNEINENLLKSFNMDNNEFFLENSWLFGLTKSEY